MKKIFGFTLAELLITLGIIGVVAALTIPGLVENYQKDVYVAQLRKVYNDFVSVFDRYLSDQRVETVGETQFASGVTSIDTFIQSNFKVNKVCAEDEYADCFASSYIKMTGLDFTPIISEALATKPSYVLASGAAISVLGAAPCDINTICSVIFVDTNSRKGPNVLGRDLFALYLYGDGRLYDVKNSRTADANFNASCNSNANSFYGCFGKILNDNWEMNY